MAEALRCFRESFALARQHPYPYFEVRARVGVARVLLATGDDEAVAVEQAALAARTARAHGFQILEAAALEIRDRVPQPRHGVTATSLE